VSNYVIRGHEIVSLDGFTVLRAGKWSSVPLLIVPLKNLIIRTALLISESSDQTLSVLSD